VDDIVGQCEKFAANTPHPRCFGERGWICLIAKVLTFFDEQKRGQRACKPQKICDVRLVIGIPCKTRGVKFGAIEKLGGNADSTVNKGVVFLATRMFKKGKGI
jgi:hypothetical protein